MTSPLKDLAVVTDCPLCMLAAAVDTPQLDGIGVHCTHCGEFVITDTGRVMVAALPLRLRIALTRATQAENAEGRIPLVGVQTVAKLVSAVL